MLPNSNSSNAKPSPGVRSATNSATPHRLSLLEVHAKTATPRSALLIPLADPVSHEFSGDQSGKPRLLKARSVNAVESAANADIICTRFDKRRVSKRPPLHPASPPTPLNPASCSPCLSFVPSSTPLLPNLDIPSIPRSLRRATLADCIAVNNADSPVAVLAPSLSEALVVNSVSRMSLTKLEKPRLLEARSGNYIGVLLVVPGIVTSVQSPTSKVELLAVPLSTTSRPCSPVRQAVGQECRKRSVLSPTLSIPEQTRMLLTPLISPAVLISSAHGTPSSHSLLSLSNPILSSRSAADISLMTPLANITPLKCSPRRVDTGVSINAEVLDSGHVRKYSTTSPANALALSLAVTDFTCPTLEFTLSDFPSSYESSKPRSLEKLLKVELMSGGIRNKKTTAATTYGSSKLSLRKQAHNASHSTAFAFPTSFSMQGQPFVEHSIASDLTSQSSEFSMTTSTSTDNETTTAPHAWSTKNQKSDNPKRRQGVTFSAVLDVASFEIVANSNPITSNSNPITANPNTLHIPDMAPIEQRILMPWIPSSTAMSTRIISAVSSPMPSSGIGLKSALKVFGADNGSFPSHAQPTLRLASRTNLECLRKIWLATMTNGSMLKKYSDRYTAQRRYFFVDKEGAKLCWRSSIEEANTRSESLCDVDSICFGTESSDRFCHYDVLEGKPWLCFTLHLPHRTVDLECENETDVWLTVLRQTWFNLDSPLQRMTHWFMGLQSLTAAHSSRSLSLGRLLWCRVSMKIQHRARRLAVSPLQVVRDLFNLAGEFRRKQLVNPVAASCINLSQTSLVSDSHLGRSLFDRLFAWS